MTLEYTPRFNALLERLLKATSPHGKKTQLAAFLQMPLPRISEWLKGTFIPGAEVTLTLLEWVTAEESQQNKNRERVLARPRRKTRSTKVCYENRKPSPPPK